MLRRADICAEKVSGTNHACSRVEPACIRHADLRRAGRVRCYAHRSRHPARAQTSEAMMKRLLRLCASGCFLPCSCRTRSGRSLSTSPSGAALGLETGNSKFLSPLRSMEPATSTWVKRAAAASRSSLTPGSTSPSGRRSSPGDRDRCGRECLRNGGQPRSGQVLEYGCAVGTVGSAWVGAGDRPKRRHLPSPRLVVDNCETHHRGRIASDLGRLDTPGGVATDANGNVFVVDSDSPEV